MEIQLGLLFLLLLVLMLLATIDLALGQLSDVGLRRLISERKNVRRRAPPSSSIGF